MLLGSKSLRFHFSHEESGGLVPIEKKGVTINSLKVISKDEIKVEKFPGNSSPQVDKKVTYSNPHPTQIVIILEVWSVYVKT